MLAGHLYLQIHRWPNGLDEEALKDIYLKFKRITIERIEYDIDSIDRYMINLVPRDSDADTLA